MGAVTFNSVKLFAKRHGIICERKGREYEAYRDSDHGSVAVAGNLKELLDEVHSFIDVKQPGIHSRRVYWNSNRDCNGYTGTVLVIGEGYDKRASVYDTLIEFAQRTFPNVKRSEIEIAQVLASDCIKGFPLIVFKTTQPKGYIPGYRSFEISDAIEFSY